MDNPKPPDPEPDTPWHLGPNPAGRGMLAHRPGCADQNGAGPWTSATDLSEAGLRQYVGAHSAIDLCPVCLPEPELPRPPWQVEDIVGNADTNDPRVWAYLPEFDGDDNPWWLVSTEPGWYHRDELPTNLRLIYRGPTAPQGQATP